MRRPSPERSRPRFIRYAFVSILAIIFVVDQANMALIDRHWDWREGLPEAASLTAICVPLLWFLAFLPLRRALRQQQEKTAQLEVAHADLAFIHDAFQMAESRYRGLFENSTIGIYQVDAGGEFLTVNPAYVDLLGYATRGQALRGGHADAYLLADRGLIRRAEQDGEVIRLESQIRRRDGRVIWVCESLRPSRDAAGTLQFYDGSLQDITERKQAEEADADSRRMLQSIIDSLPQRIFWKNTQSVLLGCNRGYAEMVGLGTSTEVLGRSDEDLFPRGIIEEFYRADRRVMEMDAPEIGFIETWDKDGVTYWNETSKIPMHDAEGRVIGLLGTATDITARMQGEERLRESEATLRRANSMLRAQQEATPDGILILDEDQRLVSFNSHYCRMWGIPADLVATGDEAEVLGYISGLLPDPAGFCDRVRYLAERPQEYAEDEIRLTDGRILERYAVPVTGEDGRNNGRVLYFRDVTGRKQAEADLRESEARLHRQNSLLLAQQEATLDSILIVDENKKIISFNRRFCELWSIPDDMIAAHRDGVDTPLLQWAVGQVADPDVYLSRVQHLYAHPFEWSEDEILLRDGRVFERSSVPVLAADGRGIGRIWYNRDITARKRAGEDLRASQEMLRLVMDSVPQNIFWKDVNSVYLGCNRAFAEGAGLTSPEDIIGRTDYELPWPREDADKFCALDRRVIDADAPLLHVPETWRLPDGRTVTAETSKVPLHDAEGRVIGILGTNEDITDRLQAQEDLRASREMLRTVMDSVPQSIVWCDRRGTVMGCNENFARLHGTDVASIVGVSARSLVSDPVYAARIAEMDERVMASDEATLHLVVPVIRADGPSLWTDISRIPLHDGAGAVIGLLVALEDITGRKQAEADLRESEARLHRQNSLLLAQQEAALDGLLIVDESQRIVNYNSRFCEMWKVPPALAEIGDDDPVLRRVLRQVRNADVFLAKVEHLYAHPQEHSNDEILLRDGRIFERRSVPVTAQDGRSNGRVWQFRDVTEQKLSEEALRQAKDQAEAASRAKSQFLANMSHELRTPMNAVIGFSEILQDQAFGPLNPRQAKYVGNILSSGRHLLQLINDILDITKIEAGRMTLDREPLDVAATMEGVHGVIKALSMKKNIEVVVAVEDGLPSVHADSACFKQILYNLFSNAIKFTPEGGRVRADVWRRDAALHVAVTDSGIGLAPEDQARIWGEFEQVDSTYARTQQGTGLGLSLTRRLVELHGGRIWVESEGDGHGCVFQFTIPLTDSAPTADPPVADADPAPPVPQAAPAVTPADGETPAQGAVPWVLLVEDDPRSSELMTHCLEEEGYAVSLADDGEQALFLAPLANPCAVLLDIEMPGKDGWEVLSELKADPRTQAIPVVIVSANQDRLRALRLGAAECFAKPFDRAALLATLRRVRAAPPPALRGHAGAEV